MDVARMLADMALELEQDGNPTTMLDRVSHYARLAVGAEDAGIMRVRSRKLVETPSATSSRVDQAHQLQAAFDQGPCLDAIKGRATYRSDDVASDLRWPQWGPASAELGIRSTVGVRLATRERGFGSLNVYADRPSAFTPADEQIIELLAAHATAAYSAADRAEGLSSALDSRTTIGQAQGILMQKFDIGSDAAFDFLKRISQHENKRLHAVAEAIVVQTDSNARPTD
ncbi:MULTISPECIES: GAF and ANTAR domain-containing protein [Aeromicrobium]|uniref:ANTAR domain-containing protein n=1 Tax=Aeromicrobium yanjiei TaxID=2662028 RepID=A0A5Q2MLD8_9ACTN|nr:MULTISPECIES: GAF and ANTAR domain-containing protein [Aeromicrobium]MRK00509.1 ANTAR domain-containing protein [Aeromicrobium sp. S22]QGG42651.1 ANTAR domain-containing protein [Aeromicrobium yanjiei]